MDNSTTVTICNRLGLHARASAKFVDRANDFQSDIWVTKSGTRVLGTSIMGLLLLAAAKGETVEISAKGPDADDAVAALVSLINSKFGEE